MIIACLLKSFK